MTKRVCGTFEPNDKGSGSLRQAKSNYKRRPDDIVIPSDICKSIGLRGGEELELNSEPQRGRNGRRITKASEIELIGGQQAAAYAEVVPFDELTAINPQEPIRFETPGGPISMRIVDLMTPIGLGQRGLIVAAPRTGKTVLLQQMAVGLAANHPDVYMMVLLINERPEEVTEMRRTVHGEVVASSSDEDERSHVRVTRLIIQKAKRMVETGRDVLILLDSLTRLGRAYNVAMQGSRRIMSGGLDIGALTEPKAVFGAARKIENGGSLTIIASCLIETGSRMDDVIFSEFKGTGNMEIMLTRILANKRIWPAIDLEQSGTRREELLLSPDALKVANGIRRVLADRGAERAIISLLDEMSSTTDNADLIAKLTHGARR